jgi:hypothetical protein
MRCLALILTIVLAATLPVQAQPPADTESPAADAPPPPREQPEEVRQLPPEPESEPEPAGDVVRLKGGGELRDVQVLRVAATGYELELAAGKVTLTIPRSQVESVEYDDYDPATGRRTPPASNGGEPVLLPAHEMPQELVNQLSTDLSDPEFAFDDRDFIAILAEAATRASVQIRVDESLRTLPVSERRWTYQAAEGSTVVNLLDALARDFSRVRVTYEGDQVVVTSANATSAASS